MKLISMHVDDFGGLHNYDYSFDDGLNVVLHDNGWGKTTMAAFLKAMLYGYDTRRSKDITENERKRYLPWQGGRYGGSLDFESEGVLYRITRSFGETPRFDTAKIINLDTKATANISPDKIGETLFHLDANAFQRSVFINQNGLSIDGAASSIHTRLNALVSQANDVAAFDGAITRLTQQVKVYEKTGARGQLGDISRQISERERLRNSMERDIAEQDAARERIIQIDTLLSQIDKDLDEKNKRLEAVSGEKKKREAAKKMLEDLREQIAVIQREMNEIEAELGGHVPTTAEIDQIKRHEQSIASLKARIQELERAHEAFAREYTSLLEKYGGALPTPAQLDEVQGIYGEIQGIITAGTADASIPDAPEAYELIHSAAERIPGFVDRLQAAVDTQVSVQNLLHQRETQTRDIQRENESWASKTKRFAELKAEMDALRAELAAQDKYCPAAAEPAIRSLEDCQKKHRDLAQQDTDVQAEIQRETKAWAEKKKRYKELKGEAERLRAELNRLEAYDDAHVRPAIAKLEELQRSQQRIAEKQETIPSIALTAEEETLLADTPDDLPDADEGTRILSKYRNAVQHQAAAQGIEARLDGEKSKADSLSASLAQLESATSSSLNVVEEPKKSAGTALIVIGILLIIAGAALGVLMMPALAAVAAAGLLLCIIGATGKNSYKKKMLAYEDYRLADAQRQEANQKKAEIQAQLTIEQADIASLEQELSKHRSVIDSDGGEVSSWVSRWGQSNGEVSETIIAQIMDHATMVRRLREKRSELERIQGLIAEQTAVIATERAAVDALFSACKGKTLTEAVALLRAGETDYKIAKEKQQSAARSLSKFVADAKVPEKQFASDVSLLLPELQKKLQLVETKRQAVNQARAKLDEQYPEIAGLAFEDALAFMRSKLNAYTVAEGQMKTADKNFKRFLAESGSTAEELALPGSPKAATMLEAQQVISEKLDKHLQNANALLAELDLDTDLSHIVQALKEAETILVEYRQYAGKLTEAAARQSRKQEQLDTLKRRLTEKLAVIHMQDTGDELPALLTAARADISQTAQVHGKIRDVESDLSRQKANLDQAEKTVGLFAASFGHFSPDGSGMLAGIYARANTFAEKAAAKQQLEKQGASAEAEHQPSDANAPIAVEAESLRAEVERLKERRDALLIEYTQKSDTIRLADQSLEKYPDLVREIHALYEQKQKAQNALGILKRTIQLITRAKENLANRYLSKVEHLFNSYMQIWLNNDAIRGLLDINFNISIEENGKAHVAEGYSTGYCDMIDFCMRLALVDTLFEKEQPFLILDDPFVNLDADRLEKALELLNAIAANKQVVYFVCHPIRAVETDESSASRTEFLKLAEATRTTIQRTKAEGARSRKIVRKSPKEMYKVAESAASHAFRPANLNYTITNSIFSMSFVMNDTDVPRDGSFELFFIDALGRVLNDRQMIEISNGKLSTNRIQFSLNTRDDSGSEYELMVRESGQDDYEVVARYPFRAKLAFAGTFSFDL
ncbi:MAG: AAA family ATPase [Clostridia bacterium]|nr:AAA family ATPase [Clostridia bacterium]